MKAVVQRVASARVDIAGQTVGAIDGGGASAEEAAIHYRIDES